MALLVKVEFDQVRFAYPRSGEVLMGLDGAWEPGIRGLLGINGAGKTTLLRLLATLAKPKSGGLLFDGESAASGRRLAELRKSIGYMPQSGSWPGTFTVAEFCEYMAWLHGVPATSRRAAVSRAIESVGLAEKGTTQLRKLSGGMHRRALLAQAIVHSPQLLILDEPTVGLDPRQRIRFRDLIRDSAHDRLVIMSTHLVEDVGALATRATVIHDGRFLFDGTPDELAGLSRPSDLGDSDLERGFSRVLDNAP
jgi:ABC-2 type transport system ATP-binding protein